MSFLCYPVQIDELKALLKQAPGDSLAFAPENINFDRLAESLAALANAAGGTLLLGVNEQGRLKGLVDPEKSLDLVVEAAFACDPPLIIPLPHRSSSRIRLCCRSRSRPACPTSTGPASGIRFGRGLKMSCCPPAGCDG